jgi:hypothetical protein
MINSWKTRIAALLLALPAAPAAAVCSGASLEEEYRGADFVVRARLVAETRLWDDEPSPAVRAIWGTSGHVLLYRLRVLETFKGAPGTRLPLFQEVNSGRFEIDPDRDYLLFLNRIAPYPGRPAAARGATYVRHACGQSKPWVEVEDGTPARLRRLAARR